MEQDDEAPDEQQEQSAEYWKHKIDELRRCREEISAATVELHKSGKITEAEATEVFYAFNEVAIYRSGSKGRADDAISYALYRDGLHQMRKRLVDLRPDLRDELEHQLPKGPSR